MKRYIPGTDPLAPMPFTDEERDDLVRRAQDAAIALGVGTINGACRAASIARRIAMTPARVAARYVRIAGVPVPDAQRAIAEVTDWVPSLTAIRSRWDEMYPGERRPTGRAGGASAQWHAAVAKRRARI